MELATNMLHKKSASSHYIFIKDAQQQNSAQHNVPLHHKHNDCLLKTQTCSLRHLHIMHSQNQT